LGVESRPTRVVNLLPAVLIGLGAVVVWGAVVQLSNALLLILLAVIIAASLNPAVIWAHRVLRLPRAIAAGAILFFVVGGFSLLLWLLVPAVIEQISSLISSVPAIVAQVQTWLADASRQYPVLKSASESLSSTDLTGQLRGLLSSVPSTLLGAVGATTGLLGGILNGALLLIVGFTVLVQPEPLLRGAISAVPPNLRDDVSRAMIRIGAQLGGWLVATLLTSFVLSILTGIGLWIASLAGVHVENIFLFAVIAGITNVIPVIGGFFGLIPPVLSSLSPRPIDALIVGIIVFGVQQLIANVLSPVLLSSRVSLHPASLLVGVLIFSGLFGILGAFLAVPFLVIIKSVYEELYLPGIGERVTEAEAQALVRGQEIAERES
jgi:putative permease